MTFHIDMTLGILRALQNTRTLKEITMKFNSGFAGEPVAEILVRLQGLTAVTLIDPSRAILQLLPDWLGRLSSTLKSLNMLVSLIATFK